MTDKVFSWGKISLPFIFCIMIAGCASGPKPLDRSEVKGPVAVSSAVFLARADWFSDEDQCRNDFQQLFLNNIGKMKEYAAKNEGIDLDESAFIAAIADTGAVEVKDLVMGRSTTIKIISWKGETRDPLHASLTAVPGENGSMQLNVGIEKEDPAYAPGYKLQFSFLLKPASE